MSWISSRYPHCWQNKRMDTGHWLKCQILIRLAWIAIDTSWDRRLGASINLLVAWEPENSGHFPIGEMAALIFHFFVLWRNRLPYTALTKSVSTRVLNVLVCAMHWLQAYNKVGMTRCKREEGNSSKEPDSGELHFLLKISKYCQISTLPIFENSGKSNSPLTWFWPTATLNIPGKKPWTRMTATMT